MARIVSRKMRLIPLVAVIFFTVSGGPYGLEPLLVYAGKHGALLLLLTVPLLWDIPAIATVLELNSMMPVTGGYYQWVKRALGMRFAFYEGWWTWLYTFVDLAIYPVLFVEYASFLFPGIEAYKIPVCLCIIWFGAGLNILGVVPVGKTALVLSVLVLLPFLLLFVKGVFLFKGVTAIPTPSLSGIGFSSLGMALYTVMWNFIGWDNATTYAGEVEKPARTYIYSTLIAFGCIVLVYTLAVVTADVSGMDLGHLNEKGFPALGEWVGGKWLGTVLAMGGMASTLGLFAAILLSVSRVPKAMADDRLLPAILQKEHPRYQTPYLSVLICAGVVSCMILWTFSDLLVIDIILYGAGLLLEFISLLVLRIKAPNEPRPFKIPLNTLGICIMIALPVVVWVIALSGALSSSDSIVKAAIFGLSALVSAEVIWQGIRLYRRNRNEGR